MKTLDEIWKEIKGYEGIYEISNLGKVKSLSRIDGNGVLRKEIIRKQSISKKGYNIIQLRNSNGCKMFMVHRLVAEAFVPNPYNKPFVNHKDEDKRNNSAENLEWCDVTYNNTYGTRLEKVKKKLGKPIISIKLDTGETEHYVSIIEGARKTNSSSRHIYSVLRGKRKSHNKRIWKYEMAGEKLWT